MENSSLDSGHEDLPADKQRNLYFLGLGFYSSIFWIDVIFFYAYRASSPHIAAARILAPVLTLVFAIFDTVILRSICRKQFPENPELLEKWPITLVKYPIWPYFGFVAMGSVIAIYLLSQI
jgi:hypothetical protein